MLWMTITNEHKEKKMAQQERAKASHRIMCSRIVCCMVNRALHGWVLLGGRISNAVIR
jgi:hypothetical protein